MTIPQGYGGPIFLEVASNVVQNFSSRILLLLCADRCAHESALGENYIYRYHMTRWRSLFRTWLHWRCYADSFGIAESSRWWVLIRGKQRSWWRSRKKFPNDEVRNGSAMTSTIPTTTSWTKKKLEQYLKNSSWVMEASPNEARLYCIEEIGDERGSPFSANYGVQTMLSQRERSSRFTAASSEHSWNTASNFRELSIISVAGHRSRQQYWRREIGRSNFSVLHVAFDFTIETSLSLATDGSNLESGVTHRWLLTLD